MSAFFVEIVCVKIRKELAALFGSHADSIVTNPEHQKEYSYHHVGYMAQSVYLVCAAKDMATVLIGSVNKEELAKVIGLPAKHIVIYTQPVGYKKK